MKIDEEGSFTDEINDYNEYIKENIVHIDGLCDKLIEQLLFYKFIVNSEYDSKDLMGKSVHSNLSRIMENVGYIESQSNIIKEFVEYMEREDVKLKWRDFEAMEPTEKFLREFKLYKLNKDEK